MHNLVRKGQVLFEYSFIEFDAEITEKWLKTAKIRLYFMLEKQLGVNKNERKNKKMDRDQFGIT